MRRSCLQAVAAGVRSGFGHAPPQATQASRVVDAANPGRSFSSESYAGDKGSSAAGPPSARPPRQPRRTYQRSESWTRLKAPPPPGSAPPPPPPQEAKKATQAKSDRGGPAQRPPAARNQQQQQPRPPPREGFKIPPRPGQGFAASGAPKDSRRPRNQGPRRDGQRPPSGRRPQQMRGSQRRGSDAGHQLPSSFANSNYLTFGEVHGEKDFIAEIYTDRDETWDFKTGSPGPWEHKEIPTVQGIATDINETLESVKEMVMTDYQKGVEAILISSQGGTKELEGAADGSSSSSSSDDDSDSSDSDSDSEKAVEAAGGEGKRLLKPGEDVELIKPKDEEMEALWKNLKDATIYNVLSHETAELKRKVKSGHSLLGAKQEEAMLLEIADNEGPEDAALRAALDKYRAVLESNASWSFADKRVVMKGLSRDLSNFS